MENLFREALAASPVIAILRHLAPENAIAVGEALIDAGVLIVEIPLNGNRALETLETLAKNLSLKALLGAGTVLTGKDVGKASSCGARFIFSPNTDPDVIRETRRLGLASVPGVATPSEAFAALQRGAAALKIFPGEMFPPKVVKTLRVVLPNEAPLIVSGGINGDNIRDYADAGVQGFGVTSALFAPDLKPSEIGLKAKKLVAALRREGR